MTHARIVWPVGAIAEIDLRPDPVRMADRGAASGPDRPSGTGIPPVIRQTPK